MRLTISLSSASARALSNACSTCTRKVQVMRDCATAVRSQQHRFNSEQHAVRSGAQLQQNAPHAWRKSSTVSPLSPRLLAYLRQSPGRRSIAYFVTAALISKSVRFVVYDEQSYAWPLIFSLIVLPFGTAATYFFVSIVEQQVWMRVPLRHGLVQATQGAALGGAAFLAVAAIAAGCGWVSTTTWGWAHHAPATLIRSVALLGIGHLAVAINEEMVFRGYGFDTLASAIGRGPAACVLTMLFALYHYQFSVQGVVGPAASGLALLLLRLSSDGLWMPVGYHWAWNVMQTALLGPPDGLPSVLPLSVHGPYAWVGRPGYPEPGALSILINLAVAAGVGVRLWRATQRVQ